MTGLDHQVTRMDQQRLLQSTQTLPVAMIGFVSIAGVKSGRSLWRQKEVRAVAFASYSSWL